MTRISNYLQQLLSLLLLLALATGARAQSYTSWIVGDPADVATSTSGGALLMGGGLDNDDAMAWMLNKSGGGDILVLRAAGTDGYNSYLYNLAPCNSVETILINSSSVANNAEVAQKIRNAEALFISGGDQYDYVSMWKDSPVEDAINYLINTKGVVVGGTSAGCAIQGGAYFDAANGTIRSDEALANPYDANLTLQRDNFINHPLLANTITDTHYDNPDRQGRHTTFMARMVADWGINARGIGVDEVTAVCVEPNGTARVFGDLNYEDYAYFLQVEGGSPETCAPGAPLTWDRGATAVKVYKIQGDNTGNRTFDLNTWNSGVGGSWEYFYACNGTFLTSCGGSGGGSSPDPAPSNYCTSAANDATYEWIDQVDIRDLYNISGNDGGYGDYSASVGTDLEIGQSYSLYIRPGFSGSSYREYCSVWIDFNRDGDFDDSGERVLDTRLRRGRSSTITIPGGASIGKTRMRVAMSYDNYPNPCESIAYGEVEDYTVNLFNAGGVARTATAGVRPALEENAVEASQQNLAYPNPAQGQIKLQLSVRERTAVDIAVYNLLGQEVKRVTGSYAPGMAVSLDGLKKGTYLLEIRAEGRSLRQKILVE